MADRLGLSIREVLETYKNPQKPEVIAISTPQPPPPPGGAGGAIQRTLPNILNPARELRPKTPEPVLVAPVMPAEKPARSRSPLALAKRTW